MWGFIAVFVYVMGKYVSFWEERARLFSEVQSERGRGNGCELQQGKSCLGIRKNLSQAG